MKFVAKVHLNEVTERCSTYYQDGKKVVGYKYKEVRFTPVQMDKAKDPEDVLFANATPNGDIKLQINNPALLDQLQAGKAFYVTFEEIE